VNHTYRCSYMRPERRVVTTSPIVLYSLQFYLYMLYNANAVLMPRQPSTVVMCRKQQQRQA
jgi:hypothetical protein